MGAFGDEKVQFNRDQPFEATDRVVETGLDRADGNAGLSRDLLDSQVLIESKHDDFTVFRGKSLQRLSEPGGAELLVRIVGRAGLTGFLQNQILLEDQVLLFAEMPTAQIPEDAMQPGV